LAEYKKRLDEELSAASATEEYKKKIAHDVEVLQEKVKTLLDTNDKLNKSKKKLMSEVCVLFVLTFLLFCCFLLLHNWFFLAVLLPACLWWILLDITPSTGILL